ncbi:MAG: hypothetical protein QM215_00150 [Bacillota bacterium]|jgi:hypothetical protein|nr:hypothetical protein [Eubacteriales bacterium]MDD3537329.1 hypothetical protein [Eubacteriales bacterium]MDI9491314.1 hypothetical protein [Bacillota bacterium]NLV70711.1 hypothetical protein [Clostridiales bacterium]HPF19281.1 hypothetical protein [Bacillota bacterium]
MSAVDVLGLPLKEAMQLLREESIVPAVHSTGSSGPAEQEENQRVVKVSVCGERWTLTVCTVPDAFR